MRFALPLLRRNDPRRTPQLMLALAAALLGAAAPLHAQAEAGVGGRFPTITSAALSGRRYSLPRDFEGRANVVLIAFRREQQRDVDTWLPTARALAADNRELRFYELPTISRGYVLLRPVIDGGMRGGIPDSATRDLTITLYTDVGRFRRALGLASDRTIHTLLVDSAGVVRWRAAGAFTPAQGDALRRAAAAVLGGRGE